MKVKVTRLGKDNKVFIGNLMSLLEEGRDIRVEDPKTPGYGLITSTIMKCHEHGVYETRNSLYRVEEIK